MVPPKPTRDDLIGQTFDHYVIKEHLGGGGMGDVYRAEDRKLRRSVALKFLPPALSRDATAMRRFTQEARAASASDHPNICTIHEINETDDGRPYIVMGYYAGETLKEKIARGPMELAEVIDLTRQIAEGLGAAHRNDVIHRDVKPANIIVTEDGIVKILDFGIAKLGEPAKLTMPGVAVGTVAYMSPEQVMGHAVDHRTDIWSLGVVLYEMLTGVVPFTAEHQQAVRFRILSQQYEPVLELRPDLPPRIEWLLDRALTQDVHGRFADVSEIVAELAQLHPQVAGEQQVSVGSPWSGPVDRSYVLRPQKSIVVLPFADISAGGDSAYFSDGLTEEIITDLSQVEALNVISRSSAMMLKNTDKSVKSIARDLNVRYVLEGGVRKEGNNLRITAQLVDAHSDVQMWADKYKGTLDDIFDIQERVALAIVEALRLRLSPTEEQRIADRPFDNVHAYECYLRARQEFYLWTEDALDRAVQNLRNGLDIVGENALLYAGLGHVYWQYVNAGVKGPEYLDRAEEYVRCVFDLEPGSAHGHRVIGLVAIFRREHERAVEHLERALDLSPNDPEALFWLSVYYGYLGRPEAGEPLIERLLRIDPLNPINHGMPGFLQLHKGRFDLALESYRKMYEMDPENPAHRFAYVQLLAFTGYLDEAAAIIDDLVRDTPEHPFAWMCSFLKPALQGDREGALAAVTPELEQAASGDLNYSWFLAECYALIDERARALDWLATAIENGFLNYPFLAEFDPLLENIRGEARFAELMNGLKERWAAVPV